MSKRAIKEGGYPLPDQIDGYTEFVCYRVDVPNSLEYRAAFLGALAELTKWWNWEKSGQAGDTRATRAASYWRELLLEFPDCEGTLFDIRQKPDFPCIIQKAYDGETWVDAVYINRCPVKIRINAGIVQWFDPVGGIWIPVEGGGDERTDGEAPAPWPSGELPPGENGACLSAENITAFYQTALTQVRGEVALGTQVTAIAAGLTGLASLFMPGALLATVALALCAAALDLGVAGLDDMLQQSHLDDLKCIIYRNAEADGSITSAGYSAIYSEVASAFGGVELTIIQLWLDGFGSVGLTRQGKAEGITTGNCDACDEPEPGTWHIPVDGDPVENGLHDLFSGYTGYQDTDGTFVSELVVGTDKDRIVVCTGDFAVGTYTGKRFKVYGKYDHVGYYGSWQGNGFENRYQLYWYNTFDNTWYGWGGWTLDPGPSLPIDGSEVLIQQFDAYRLGDDPNPVNHATRYAFTAQHYNGYRITRIEMEDIP